MIVEDEVALLELTADALRELGHEPVAFESAPAALESFCASPASFAALITDLQMPALATSLARALDIT
jgi:CheY-like chemotaxis protein